VMGRASNGSRAFLGFLCARRGKSLHQINWSAGAWWDALLTSQGCPVLVTTRWKHHLQVPDKPPEMLQESWTETQYTKAFQEAILISMPAAARQIHIQRLNSETMGSHLVYLCKQVTEAKSKVWPMLSLSSWPTHHRCYLQQC
jgi:hypothetical protein